MSLFFTSESVTEGHPDKVADQISDSILDAMLEGDKNSRVACETFVGNGLVLVSGEISTSCYVDVPNVVRTAISDIGYTDAKYGLDAKTCAVISCINEQSADIAMGVDQAMENKMGNKDAASVTGAGDQGMMFGYACNETPDYMPLPISLAHKLTFNLARLRKEGILDYLRPDGKSQVTIEYVNGIPKRVDTVIIAAQHSPDVLMEDLTKDIINKLIVTVIPENLIDKNTRYLVNPTGRFVIGGPSADTGLTGRKIIVDTYGGFARHGGGAFSGKDPTKVDRSASYLARYIAKNTVAAGLAEKCEIQLAYSIGVADPVSVAVETFGTGKISDERITGILRKTFDMRPAAIINNFDLRRPIYKQLASYGHFGRESLNLPWERLDKVAELSVI